MTGGEAFVQALVSEGATAVSGLPKTHGLAQFGRTMMIDLHNPDFAKMAESFGAYGVTVGGVDEVGPALREAFAADRPAVAEIRTSLPHPYDTDW